MKNAASITTPAVLHSGAIDILAHSQQEKMASIVKEYSSQFRQHQGSMIPIDSRKYVLLTGSTGGLGSFILNALIMDNDIAKVYCINRRGQVGSLSISERQSFALLDKGLAVNILKSPKVHLLEGCLDEENWGLEASLYSEMLGSVTHIIHNAWPLNFSMSLELFEPSIRSVRSLIDFSLSSMLVTPPLLLFTSTMGIFQKVSSLGLELPETPIEANAAIGYGYTESKWVSEKILLVASEQTAVKTVIVRVGQLCSGPNGSWNVKEWFPALVQAAKLVSCLPARTGSVSWLPMDVAANSLVEFLHCDKSTIMHLVHPKPVPWTCLATRLSSILDVPIVPTGEWIRKVERTVAVMSAVNATASHSQSRKAMAAKPLLAVFREKAALSAEVNCLMDAFGVPATTSMWRGLALSRSLSDALPIGEVNVDAWVSYWKQVGFI